MSSREMRRIASAVLVPLLLMVFAPDVRAGTIVLTMLAVEVDGTRQGITPCFSVDPGLYSAGKAGAELVYTFTIVYQVQGDHKSETHTLKFSDVKQVGDAGPQGVIVEAKLHLAAPMDKEHAVLTAQLHHRSPAGDVPIGAHDLKIFR